MTDLNNDSYIDFGTPDASIIGSTEVIYITIEDENYWWTSHVTGFRWGSSMNDSTEYIIPETEGLTDTGSSCIIGPSYQLTPIMNTILNLSDTVTRDNSWDYLFDCDDAALMPSFELLYGGYWFEVLPEDYIIEVWSN